MQTRAITVLIVVVLAAAGPLAGGLRHDPPDGPPPAMGGTDASRGAAQATVNTPWIEKLLAWRGAVAAHQPGSADAPAQHIGSWSEAELDATRTDLIALVAILWRESSLPDADRNLIYRGMPARTILQALGLSDVRQVNPLLRRAAVFHADIAMLVTPRRVDGVGCSARSTVLVVDGMAVGTGCNNYHWRHARLLLDKLEPSPAKDAFAPRWYHATAVFLLEATNYSDAQAHLTQARLVLPKDADIAFEWGYYQEALAAPRVQVLVGASRASLGAPESYLRAAEEAFRRALELRPDFAEARMRRGAVLSRQGRHKDAAAELRLALQTARDPVLRYLAEIFLARASEGLRDVKAAREHYERARDAMPAAQAPLLALGRLARSTGDRGLATEAVRRVIDPPPGQGIRADPWWDYNIWQERNSRALLRELDRLLDLDAGDTR